jgi:valyl-tRNA synthetase
MLHPAVPFVTESLWQRLPRHAAGQFLMTASWPAASNLADPQRAAEFEVVREAVLAIRQIRGDNTVAPSRMIEASLVEAAAGGGEATVRRQEANLIGQLTRSTFRFGTPDGVAAHALLAGGGEIVVPLAGLVDLDKECARLREELTALDKQIVSRAQRLENAKYLERAPANIVANDRATLDEMRARRDQLAAKVESLCGG